MVAATLEIMACAIAAIMGIGGAAIGLSHSNPWMVSVSGALACLVVIYLSSLAELMQKPESRRGVVICEILNKLIYATMVLQTVTAVLMVN